MLDKAFSLKVAAARIRPQLIPTNQHSNMLDPGRIAAYLRRVEDIDPAAARMLATAFDNMTYIDTTTLITKMYQVIDVLNAYAAQTNTQLVVGIPGTRFKDMKSNMWLTMLVANRLKFQYAVTIPSKLPLALEGKTEIILFDDVMYSGAQMSEFIEDQREIAAVPVFACVPFVHDPKQIETLVHPALRAVVAANSVGLHAAKDFLPKELFNVNERQTMTYLQMKHPDELSIPQFLLVGSNPFNRRTSQHKKFSLGLIRDCDGQDRHHCPWGFYKQLALPNLAARTYHRDLVLETIVGNPPCLFTKTPLPNTVVGGLVPGYPSSVITALAHDLGTPLSVALPPTLSIKTVSTVETEMPAAQSESVAMVRMSGNLGVVPYYGCVTMITGDDGGGSTANSNKVPERGDESPPVSNRHVMLYMMLSDLSQFVTLRQARASRARDVSWAYQHLLPVLSAFHMNGVVLEHITDTCVYIHQTQNVAMFADFGPCCLAHLGRWSYQFAYPPGPLSKTVAAASPYEDGPTPKSSKWEWNFLRNMNYLQLAVLFGVPSTRAVKVAPTELIVYKREKYLKRLSDMDMTEEGDETTPHAKTQHKAKPNTKARAQAKAMLLNMLAKAKAAPKARTKAKAKTKATPKAKAKATPKAKAKATPKAKAKATPKAKAKATPKAKAQKKH